VNESSMRNEKNALHAIKQFVLHTQAVPADGFKLVVAQTVLK